MCFYALLYPSYGREEETNTGDNQNSRRIMAEEAGVRVWCYLSVLFWTLVWFFLLSLLCSPPFPFVCLLSLVSSVLHASSLSSFLLPSCWSIFTPLLVLFPDISSPPIPSQKHCKLIPTSGSLCCLLQKDEPACCHFQKRLQFNFISSLSCT